MGGALTRHTVALQTYILLFKCFLLNEYHFLKITDPTFSVLSFLGDSDEDLDKGEVHVPMWALAGHQRGW